VVEVTNRRGGSVNGSHGRMALGVSRRQHSPVKYHARNNRQLRPPTDRPDDLTRRTAIIIAVRYTGTLCRRQLGLRSLERNDDDDDDDDETTGSVWEISGITAIMPVNK